MEKIKIFTVDDHVVLRDSLGALLEKTGKFEVTGSAADGLEAVTAFKNGAEADVMILDISMPKMNGYEVAEQMRTLAPQVKILFLTMLDTDFSLIKALQLGAKGMARKDISTEALQEALTLIAADGYYYCQNTHEKLAGLFKDPLTTASLFQKNMFTEQELEFIRYSGTDMGYKEIAAQMNLPPNVIENLKYAVFDKADVKTRNPLVLFAVKNGLIHY